MENPEKSPNEIVEINGRKYEKVYVGNDLGWDDEPLTEKRFFSHSGPGWDGHMGYLEDRGVSSLDDLSDEPYIYKLIPTEEDIKRQDEKLGERKRNAKLFRLMQENADKFPDFQELKAHVEELLRKEKE